MSFAETDDVRFALVTLFTSQLNLLACFVLKATARFLQSSEILKRKYQYDQQHAAEMNDNPFGNQVGSESY